MKNAAGTLCAVSVLALLIPVPVMAQNLSNEEMLNLFLAQRDLVRAAQSSGNGETRGLTIITESTVVAGTLDSEQPLIGAVADKDAVVLIDAAIQVNVHIEFALDSAALAPDQKPALTQVCEVMKAADIKLFRIVGHTDASGSDAYNQNLSLLRAEEVQRYFINECGIDPGRLQAVGLGERFIPEGTDPNAPENRRVEFQALA